MTDATRKLLEPFVLALGIAHNEDLLWKVLNLAYLAGRTDEVEALVAARAMPEPKEARDD